MFGSRGLVVTCCLMLVEGLGAEDCGGGADGNVLHWTFVVWVAWGGNRERLWFNQAFSSHAAPMS